VVKPIPGARPSQPTLQDWFNASGSSEHETRIRNVPKKAELPEDSDSDDQDSWIEDDGGEAAVPILPEGYSMLGHQSLAHHFKVVMQMFVHLACMKARKRWGFRVDDKNGGLYAACLTATRVDP
jgi:hypothetical protein